MAVVLVTVLPIAAVRAADPVLTGRWGDERMPQQLVYNSATKKTSALVVVTFSTKCPLARRMVPRLNELQTQYAAEGVQFIALFPNGVDNLREIAEYAVASELVFPVFQDDPENPWHVELGLKTTPQVAVLDMREGYKPERVIYRGQINGRWFGGGTANEGQEYLADALAAFVLTNRRPWPRRPPRLPHRQAIRTTISRTVRGSDLLQRDRAAGAKQLPRLPSRGRGRRGAVCRVRLL